MVVWQKRVFSSFSRQARQNYLLFARNRRFILSLHGLLHATQACNVFFNHPLYEGLIALHVTRNIHKKLY
jgi:hypothetical protein